MAGAALQIQIDRTIASAALTRVLAALGNDTQPLMADIGEYLLISHRQRFEDQKDKDGQPWAPLSPGYRARKK